MSEAIRMHKRMAMYGMGEANKMKSGGKVGHYAEGGKVMPEKGVDKLPARTSAAPPLPKPVPHAIATLKKGGAAKKAKGGIAVMIGIKPVKKAAGRGR